MENRNTVVALLLIAALWMGYLLLFPPAPSPPPVNSSRPESEAIPQKPEKEAGAVKLPPAPVIPLSTEGGDEREIRVETDKYLAVFSSRGGRLTHFQLKEYRQEAKKEAPLVTLVEEMGGVDGTLQTIGQEGWDIGGNALYQLDRPEKELLIGTGEKQQLVFSARLGTGLVVEKVYTLNGGKYEFDLALRVSNLSESEKAGSLVLGLIQPLDEKVSSSRYGFVGPATFVNDKLQQDDVKKLSKEGAKTYGDDVVWTGFEKKYFLSAVVPRPDSLAKVRIEQTDETIENLVFTPSHRLKPGESLQFDYLVFLGPKDYDLLQGIGHQLQEAIDFGFFSLIARPLLFVLKFFYQYIGNYGVAIILLTVIIKALFWPLTQKTYSSMKGMQKLQPEMQKIREKYKNDRERLNRELMELYRKNRVNPLGGCLPMLVQIPVFFALYKVLLISIELRHAPFAFWIMDLSAKDPYYVTPLIMGATMFLQQKLSPSTMDPAQAKMFMIMPVVFTFLFLNFPSGLVIYWLVNNILTIGQQFLINRQQKA